MNGRSHLRRQLCFLLDLKHRTYPTVRCFACCSPLVYDQIVSLNLYLVTCESLAPGDYAWFHEKRRTLDPTQILQARGPFAAFTLPRNYGTT